MQPCCNLAPGVQTPPLAAGRHLPLLLLLLGHCQVKTLRERVQEDPLGYVRVLKRRQSWELKLGTKTKGHSCVHELQADHDLRPE